MCNIIFFGWQLHSIKIIKYLYCCAITFDRKERDNLFKILPHSSSSGSHVIFHQSFNNNSRHFWNLNQNRPDTPPSNLSNQQPDKPASEVKCRKCGGIGNFASQCPTKSKPKPGVHFIKDSNLYSDEGFDKELLKD